MPPRKADGKRAAAARHLTTEELADRLGGDISPETVKDWRRDGKGPDYLKTGSGRTATVRYPVAWVEEWEQSCRVTPGGAREPQPA